MAGHRRNFGGSNDIISGRNEFNNVSFGGSNDIQSGRNEFNNVSFGGSNDIQSGRNEFNNVFFRGNREVDHNKTMFNRSGAFNDGMNYFRGNSPDTFAHSRDRNIVYNASGCGQMNARGKKRPPINPFTPTTGGYDPRGARQGSNECIPPQVMVNGVCVDRGLGGDPAGRQIGEPEECIGGCSPSLGVGCPKGCECHKKRCIPDGYARGIKPPLFSTQADDPANRKLNAKGRAASLPKARANEDIRDYSRRAGFKLSDPQGVIGERADGCDCRCVGTPTGQTGGAYNDYPSGMFINCCGGKKCAWVGTFGARAGEVQPLSALKKSRPSGGRPLGGRPSKSGKAVARGSGKIRKTKNGMVLVNDIGDDIPVGKTSHPCCNGGNLCNSTFNCLDGSGSYPIMGCCDSLSYCSGLGAGEGNPCGGAYEIIPSPESPNLQGSTNFRGRDLTNGGFRLR